MCLSSLENNFGWLRVENPIREQLLNGLARKSFGFSFATLRNFIPEYAPSIQFGSDGMPSAGGVGKFSTNGNEFDVGGWLGNTSDVKQYAIINKQKMTVNADNFDGGKTMVSVETSTTIVTYTHKMYYAAFLCSNNLVITSETFFNTPYLKQSTKHGKIADTSYFTGNGSVKFGIPGTKIEVAGQMR